MLNALQVSVNGRKDIGIGGRNATDINFPNIAKQVMFFDTTKYFQHSLGTLASNLTDKEKYSIKTEYKKFL